MSFKVKKKSVIVIGAGIAGATTAFTLQQAGCKVIVLDMAVGPAMGASANPICMMYPRFDAQWNRYTHFYLAAYKYAINFYRAYPQFFIPTGVMAIAREDQLRKFMVLAEMLGPDICSLHNAEQFASKGLLLPQSGYLYTKRLCEFLLQNIEVHYQQAVHAIEKVQGIWQVLDEDGMVIGVAESVVIAAGYAASQFIPSLIEKIYMVRGQSSATASNIGFSGKHVMCFPHISITPSIEGMHYFGSTYERDNYSPEVTKQSHQQNISNLSKYLPMARSMLAEEVDGYAGNRCFSKDYLPIVGEVSGCSGLYLNIAHGSRGVVSAPIAADIISGVINNSLTEEVAAEIISPKSRVN